MWTHNRSLPPLRRLDLNLNLNLSRSKPSPLTFTTRRTLSASKPKDSRSRLRRLNDRLPSLLRAYTTPLLGAPVTHITSFLILHEVTAILPLFGLVGAFHYSSWMPELGAGGAEGAFEEGIQRFGRWLRRKGWVDEGDVGTVDAATVTGQSEEMMQTERKGARLVVEFATAYAITKALLPVRLAASVWATPWFAKSILGPLGKGAGVLLGRK